MRLTEHVKTHRTVDMGAGQFIGEAKLAREELFTLRTLDRGA